MFFISLIIIMKDSHQSLLTVHILWNTLVTKPSDFTPKFYQEHFLQFSVA